MLRRPATVGRWLRQASSTAFPAYGSIGGAYTLANGHDVHYTCHGPSTAAATVVLLHGAPGSFKDFKYLAPLLVETLPQLNVLALDLPGNGRTSGDAAGGQAHMSSETVATAATEAVNGLLRDNQPVILLGHSFGGHTAMQVAAATSRDVRGLVLLNSVGLDRRPYERFAAPFSRLLRTDGLLRELVIAVNHWRYMNIFKFPKKTPMDDLTFALQRLGSSDFDAIDACVTHLRAKQLPSIVAYAMDDIVVRPNVGLELSERLAADVHLAYPVGGHNLQKTQVKDVVANVATWITTRLGL
ncbi:hypothetical protein SPRG_22150 [Saprolegnia parasitica CBS 223.65]|uniref:AB hydrolase-1 domain-containing protein n=1 Tax=Saprolegnia parasitica (strain CBS 223.65) TaxID=695850 RepID=A0A067CUS6_SAPPC|nr:hypothetical protein SPRG_22150 [Saprolegnia parasitica CBS 223.65]KDO30266.1 hypothetical protein SPRG_22150 [Saprolegnia parasitica CBS 223.65]|eukprot:XP_012199101.1 hypothetical protein SPRG_22150 [Saprolegnia parasitica CBS 223.65]